MAAWPELAVWLPLFVCMSLVYALIGVATNQWIRRAVPFFGKDCVVPGMVWPVTTVFVLLPLAIIGLLYSAYVMVRARLWPEMGRDKIPKEGGPYR